MATDKFCNLRAFIKEHNKKLDNVIDDICAGHLFTQRRAVTFLNPTSSKLIEKLSDSKVDAEERFKMMRSLFIDGRHPNGVSKGLHSLNRKKIEEDLASVTKHRANQWETFNKSVVYDYSADHIPKEGESIVITKKQNVKGKGESGHENCSYKVTQELFKDMDHMSKEELHVKVTRTLSSLLGSFKDTNSELFNKCIEALDPNMSLSWFILVKPSPMSSYNESCNDYISSDIFDQWYDNVYSDEALRGNMNAKIIQDIFTNDSVYKTDRSKVQKQSLTRHKFKDACIASTSTKGELIKSLVEAYSEFNSNPEIKLLEDELRFHYSDAFGKKFNKDTVHDLLHLNWKDFGSSSIIFNKFISDSVASQELCDIRSSFISSNAFLYVNYDDSIFQKITNLVAGAGEGKRKVITILGKKSRNMHKMEYPKMSLAKFVKSLSSSEKAELKKLL